MSSIIGGPRASLNDTVNLLTIDVESRRISEDNIDLKKKYKHQKIYKNKNISIFIFRDSQLMNMEGLLSGSFLNMITQVSRHYRKPERNN